MTESNNNITETNVISDEKEERCEQKTPSKIKQETDEIVQENVDAINVCSASDKQLTTCDAFVKSITKKRILIDIRFQIYNRKCNHICTNRELLRS